MKDGILTGEVEEQKQNLSVDDSSSVNDAEKIFNGTSLFYSRYRPTYPHDIIDTLSEVADFSSDWTVADIGSGTGILATLFLENGNHVKCIEPNGEMREMSIRNLAGAGKVDFIEGTGESSGLPDASVDLVVCGQSFHWMDAKPAMQEFSRILRGRKWVALIWNDRVMDPGTFTWEYESVVRKYSSKYHSTGSTVLDWKDLGTLFRENFETFQFPNVQKLTLDAVIGRYRSASYAITQNDPAYWKMVDDFSSIFHRYETNGSVEMVYRTVLFLGSI
jgi:SAM-dependent methyltransferase